MPLDALLWQAMTNLLSVIVTQLHSMCDDLTEESRPVLEHRIGILRQIGQDLMVHAEQLEAKMEGGGIGPDLLEKLCDDFTAFLAGVADHLDP